MVEFVGKHVKALYSYEAADDTELSFYAGDIILVTALDANDGWLQGNKNGEPSKMFPSNYVELVAEDDGVADTAQVPTTQVIADNSDVLVMKDQEIEELKAKLAAKEQELVNLQQINADMQIASNQLELVQRELSARNGELESLNQQQIAEIGDLKIRLNSFQDVVNKDQEEITNLLAEKNALEANVDNLRESLAASEKRCANTSQRLDDAIALSTKGSDEALAHKQTEIDNLTRKVNELELQNQFLSTQLDDCKNAKQHQVEKEEPDQSLWELRQQLDMFSQEKQDLLAQVQSLTQQLDTLNANLDNETRASRQAQNVASSAAEQTKQLESKSAQIATLRQLNAKSVQALDAVVTRVTNVQAQIRAIARKHI